MDNSIFKNLFVLELARNHWGSVSRGKEIISQYADVVKKNNIKAAIKLQAFDTDNFIHKDFLPEAKDEIHDKENTERPGTRTRYIKKTLATKLSPEEFKELVDEIKKHGLYTMVTPYDEASVDLCEELNVDIMKIASSDTGCITLVEKIINLGKPLSISTGIINLEHIDRVIKMAEERDIPVAINHCVSNYPSDDSDLQLNQIEFLKDRYPKQVIGFSAHDFKNITLSHAVAYTKGACTFERHIDIDFGDYPVSKYCITPAQANAWFKAHNAIVEMTSGPSTEARSKTDTEKKYIQSVNRGMYALRDIPEGHEFTHKDLGKDFYLAVPLQDGQISSRELDGVMVAGEDISKDSPIRNTNIRKK